MERRKFSDAREGTEYFVLQVLRTFCITVLQPCFEVCLGDRLGPARFCGVRSDRLEKVKLIRVSIPRASIVHEIRRFAPQPPPQLILAHSLVFP